MGVIIFKHCNVYGPIGMDYFLQTPIFQKAYKKSRL